MSAPVLWILLPLVLAGLLLIIGKQKFIFLVACLLSLFLAMAAWLLPIDIALTIGSWTFKLAPSFEILGRNLTLTSANRSFLILIYGSAFFWFIPAASLHIARRMIPLGLAITSLLVAALAVCFVSVSISFMVYVWYDATVVEDFRPVRDFASQIAEKVPKGAKLVSYGGVSSTFVYYYGTVVQPIPDSESLYQCYKQGDWIVATSADVVGLLEDGHFGMVYYKAYQPKLRKHAVGGLFHKSE